MNNIVDIRSARNAAMEIKRSMDRVFQMKSISPSLVKIATDPNGDKIAFWNDGSAREFNYSDAQRKLSDIKFRFPDALKTRSGRDYLRTELPI